ARGLAVAAERERDAARSGQQSAEKERDAATAARGVAEKERDDARHKIAELERRLQERGKPAGDKPAADKPTGDKPTGDKPAADKPTGDKAASDKAASDKAAADRAAVIARSRPRSDRLGQRARQARRRARSPHRTNSVASKRGLACRLTEAAASTAT
ncbi:MAG TPA: hypothetical protein VIX73_31025, partial [Kofleriaceae bacterium]